MANEKLLIEIVLDDGSVKQGFATVNREAQKVGKTAGKALAGGDEFSNAIDDIQNRLIGLNGPIGNLASNFRGLLVPLGLVGAAVVGVRAAFNAITEADRIDQISRQFDVAAERAGLFGTSLRASLQEAEGGLFDFELVLQQTALAVNELGAGVQQYPELLRAARNATILFGGDANRNFELLNQAILSGRTRSLQQIGLFIDQTKAVNDFAKSLGVSADALTEAGRRQAILNAVISESRTAFAAAGDGANNLRVNLATVQETFNALGDRIAFITRDIFGTAFNSILQQSNEFATALRQLITPLNELSGAEQITILERRLVELNGQLRSIQAIRFGDNIRAEIAEVSAQLAFAKSNADFAADAVRRLQELQGQQGQDNSAFVQSGLTEAQQRDALANQQRFDQQLLALQNEAAQNSLNARLFQATEEERLRLLTEQAELLHKQRLEQIERDFAGRIGIDSNEINQIKLAEQTRFNAQLEQLNEESAKRQADQNRKNGITQLQIVQATQQALVSTVSAGVQAIGASLVQGGGAFSNFRNTVLGIFGDLLINIGQGIIAASQAIQALATALSNPLTGALGGIAGGLALIAIGGLLKSLAGTTATSSAPAPTFSGGVTDVGGEEPEFNQPIGDQERERRADTSVQVVINGDVLDSDESGSRIISLINEAFDKKGVTIRRGATA